MSSAIENHMTKENLGPEASKQDWTDLKTLREELRWWEETIYSLGHPEKERNRWSQVPPNAQDKKSSRLQPRGQTGQGKKEVSCFHASTRVRMFTKETGAPEYKRMDKLVKGDQYWTRRYSRNALYEQQKSSMRCHKIIRLFKRYAHLHQCSFNGSVDNLGQLLDKQNVLCIIRAALAQCFKKKRLSMNPRHCQ